MYINIYIYTQYMHVYDIYIYVCVCVSSSCRFDLFYRFSHCSKTLGNILLHSLSIAVLVGSSGPTAGVPFSMGWDPIRLTIH